MESCYGIGVTNRYELFYDDEVDPLELLKQQEEEKLKAAEKASKKEAKKTSKGLSKKTAAAVKTIAAVTLKDAPATTPAAAKPLARRNDGRTDRTNDGRDGGNNPRERRDFNAVNNEERKMNKRNNENNRDFQSRPPREDGFDGPRRDGGAGGGFRGARGGGFGGRGGRGGEGGGFRGGRREFDRRSGNDKSGVKPTDKRGGEGAHNWGSETDKNNWDEQPEQHEAAPVAEGVPDIPVSGDEAPAADDKPVEPEVIEKTLDQWKQEQEAKRSKAAYSTNIRKANEGEKEDPKWKKMYCIKKNKNDSHGEDEVEGSTSEDDSEDEEERAKKQLEEALSKQFHFTDSRGGGPRGRGGRGGRGAMPRGPQQGGRQQRQQQHTPRVEDLNDFPSLAA